VAGQREAQHQTPSLPAADPRSDRFRCAGRESKFLAADGDGNVFGMDIKAQIQYFFAHRCGVLV
jgi:hypothetical protein